MQSSPLLDGHAVTGKLVIRREAGCLVLALPLSLETPANLIGSTRFTASVLSENRVRGYRELTRVRRLGNLASGSYLFQGVQPVHVSSLPAQRLRSLILKRRLS
jgi:hypothetical protein